MMSDVVVVHSVQRSSLAVWVGQTCPCAWGSGGRDPQRSVLPLLYVWHAVADIPVGEGTGDRWCIWVYYMICMSIKITRHDAVGKKGQADITRSNDRGWTRISINIIMWSPWGWSKQNKRLGCRRGTARLAVF